MKPRPAPALRGAAGIHPRQRRLVAPSGFGRPAGSQASRGKPQFCAVAPACIYTPCCTASQKSPIPARLPACNPAICWPRPGRAALHAKLLAADPETAAKLRPSDSSASPAPMKSGSALAGASPIGRRAQRQSWTAGPRAWSCSTRRARNLREAVETRFNAMLAAGAIDELRDLLAKNLDPALPLMRAHGVPELTPYLKGEATLAQACTRATLATHQYTKRQATWFRHQKLVDNSAMQTIHSRIGDFTQYSESLLTNLDNFINARG